MAIKIKRILLFVLLVIVGCGQSPDLELTQSRQNVSLQGAFITESPDEVGFPVKVLFAIDCSLSMGDESMGIEGGSDPRSLRLQAVQNFVDEYNLNENVSFEIMLWNQSVFDTTRTLTPGGNWVPGFTKDPAEIQRVIDGAYVDTMTDYIGTLDRIYSDIERDILNTEDEDSLVRTKYIVVFLSDGMSNIGSGPQDDLDIWEGVENIATMVSERGVGGFNFHTFLLTESFDSDGSAAALYVRGLCENTLQGMSDRGDGRFSIFETAESIDFINVIDMRLTFEYRVKYIIAYNYNVRPGLEIVYVDSDGDGLSDEEEMRYPTPEEHTDPLVRDTDNDGLSDFFEHRLSTPGNELNPLVADSPCEQPLSGEWPDSDEDGMTDCEEFVKGTNRFEVDSDKDGIPDGIEFLSDTNPLETQYLLDSDFDGMEDWKEVQYHTNVLSNDPKLRQRYSYIYNMVDQGLVGLDQGTAYESYVRLFDFSVQNIDIMDTQARILPNGEEWLKGDNLIRFYIAQVPEDRPDASPIFRMVEIVVNMNDLEKTISIGPGDFSLIQ